LVGKRQGRWNLERRRAVVIPKDPSKERGAGEGGMEEMISFRSHENVLRSLKVELFVLVGDFWVGQYRA
jgi:hypothetical protein